MCHHYDLEQLTTTAEPGAEHDDAESEAEEAPVADD